MHQCYVQKFQSQKLGIKSETLSSAQARSEANCIRAPEWILTNTRKIGRGSSFIISTVYFKLELQYNQKKLCITQKLGTFYSMIKDVWSHLLYQGLPRKEFLRKNSVETLTTQAIQGIFSESFLRCKGVFRNKVMLASNAEKSSDFEERPQLASAKLLCLKRRCLKNNFFSPASRRISD